VVCSDCGVFVCCPSVLRHCCLGVRKSRLACKNWVMRCWCGYLSGVWCRLFAYGPADATAIAKPHHLLPHLNPDRFYLSGTGLPRLSWKRGRWTGVGWFDSSSDCCVCLGLLLRCCKSRNIVGAAVGGECHHSARTGGTGGCWERRDEQANWWWFRCRCWALQCCHCISSLCFICGDRSFCSSHLARLQSWELVDKFCYLGDMLSVDGDADAAVEARIRIG